MRDAISGLIGRYDQQGRYFDRMAIDRIETFLGESDLRIRAVELINRDAAEIVREASQRLFLDEPELLLPGGNATPQARGLPAGHGLLPALRQLCPGGWRQHDPERAGAQRVKTPIRVLGLTGPVEASCFSEKSWERLRSEGVSMERLATVREPFDHMARGLAETNVRQR